MIEKDIKVEPDNDDITRTMFLSVYDGFELQLSKDYDGNDYCFSLGYESLGDLDLNGNTLTINAYNSQNVKIKYCPLCGRKLKEN